MLYVGVDYKFQGWVGYSFSARVVSIGPERDAENCSAAVSLGNTPGARPENLRQGEVEWKLDL
jgi:hypothetical protein